MSIGPAIELGEILFGREGLRRILFGGTKARKEGAMRRKVLEEVERAIWLRLRMPWEDVKGSDAVVYDFALRLLMDIQRLKSGPVAPPPEPPKEWRGVAARFWQPPRRKA